jgi:hypothetical protein
VAGLWSNYDHDDDEWYLFYRFYLGPVLGSFAFLGWGLGIFHINGWRFRGWRLLRGWAMRFGKTKFNGGAGWRWFALHLFF